MTTCTTATCTIRVPPCGLERDAIFVFDVATEGDYSVNLREIGTTSIIFPPKLIISPLQSIDAYL